MERKGVIFDLDGILLNHIYTLKDIYITLFKNIGLVIPTNFFEDIKYLNFEQRILYITDLCETHKSKEEITNIFIETAYFQYNNNAKFKNGAYQYLVHLMEKGIKIAIASSLPQILYEASLKSLKVYSFFDFIIDTNQIKKNKKFPDIYFACFKAFNIKPEECIVFENDIDAILTAKSLNTKVYTIYNEYNLNHIEQIFENVDEYITDFRELIL